MPVVLVAAEASAARDGLRFALEENGFVVLEASDGLAAVRAALRARPDAVVLGELAAALPARAAARLLANEPTAQELAVVLADRSDAAPREVVEAVREQLIAADQRRAGRPPFRFSPIDLDDDDVLARVCAIVADDVGPVAPGGLGQPRVSDERKPDRPGRSPEPPGPASPSGDEGRHGGR